MFTLAAAGQRNSNGTPGQGRGVRLGRWQSRVRGLGEAFGELPVACLAEEIDTPGEGQVRALITMAGNPVVSTPNSGRLEQAVEGLEFMLAVDIYVNETTRHADVILPGPGPLAKSHYDLALYQLAARSVANYSPPALEHDGPAEWEVLLRLAGVVSGQGPDADVEALDRLVIDTLIGRELADPHSRVAGRDAGRAARGARAAPRTGAGARLHAPRGTVRRRLRRRSRRPHAGRARAQPARRGPGSPPPADTRGAPHAVRQDRARAGGDRGRPSAPGRRDGAAPERRHGPDRAPPAALEQLVDAQPAGAREGQGPLHDAGAPRRRDPARARGRRHGAGDAPPRASSRRPWSSPTR